ncbi:Rab-like protein 2A [Chytriomyces hyalinus]|nr:Rab-like protein 2A [Chytriomyces hyalinus]
MSNNSRFETNADVKVILLGDSAVGKSKLIERFLLNDFVPHQLSTYALTLYRHQCPHPTKHGETITVEFWDTAGQERFNSMHPSYYLGAHAVILCFDMTRKITYKNLDTWFDQLTSFRGLTVPIVVIANKVDMDPSRARKSFGFVDRRRQERSRARLDASKVLVEANKSLPSADGSNDANTLDEDMPLFMCSASDGTNVVAAFKEAVRRAVKFKEGGEVGATFVDEILSFIREEEESANGLFSSKAKEAKEDEESVSCKQRASEKISSDVHDSVTTLYHRESSQSVNAVRETRGLDSDEEDDIAMTKNLARLKDIRRANLSS